MEKKKTRRRFIYKTPLFYSLPIFLFIVCALSTTPCPSGASLDIRRSFTAAAKADLFQFQEELGRTVEKKGRDEEMVRARASTRRYLSGPGSWPPRCTSKCGKCTPCKPVHVPVPPGTPVTAEYYPEAWRCKCGNKLYMP